MLKTLKTQSVVLIGFYFLFISPVAFGADLLIQLESYIPYEKCTMAFSVYSDGSAKYKGKHCSTRSVHIHPRLSATEVESIRQLIKEVRFCELRKDYDANDGIDNYIVMDSETLEIRAYCGNAIKSVSVYGMLHILDTDLPEIEHPDRGDVSRFERLNSYVFSLLVLKMPQ